MILETDVAILGAGPAGSAAAIWATRNGLDTVLLDRAAEVEEKPGETLHPGVEPILARLGVLPQVLAAGFYRHEGHWVEHECRRTFSAYGSHAGGPWFGFQAIRQSFDAILLAAAIECGARVLRPIRVRRPVLQGRRVSGLELDGALVRSKFVIDAAGGSHWLARHLVVPIRHASPTLIARYGYSFHSVLGDGSHPVFRWEHEGWTWEAPLADGRHALVHLNVTGSRAARDMNCTARFRGANVTWRVAEETAGPGYFLVGDAASVLDPAASHGILKAMMSGMLASDLITQVRRGRASEPQAIAAYRSWTDRWFWSDVIRLRELYTQMTL